MKFLKLLPVFALAPCLVHATVTNISAEDIHKNWQFYGKGIHKVERNMFYMKESLNSSGVMVISPESYGSNIKVSYEIMPLTAASVAVTMLGVSDKEDATLLTVPKGYDGAMGLWLEKNNYFFAHHNAAHNTTPFVRSFPEKKLLDQHDENVMSQGVFHKVEIEQEGDNLTMEIDGDTVVKAKDARPHKGGRIAFRLRGLSEEQAGCLIRNVKIETN